MRAVTPHRRSFLVLLGYAAATAIFTWPLARDPMHAFLCAGPRADAPMFVWNAWHFAHQVWHGANPLYTTMLLYPRGSDLLLHTYTLIVGLLAAIFGNPVAAVNFAVAASFLFSAFGAFRLTERFVHYPPASFIAGLVFSFSSVKLAHLPEHTNLILTGAIPFFVLAYLNAWDAERGTRARRLTLAGVWFIVTLSSDYYFAYYELVFVVAHLGYRLGGPVIAARRWTWKSIVVIVVALLLLARSGMLLLERAGFENLDALRYSADVLGYLLPAASNVIVGSAWLQRVHDAVMTGGAVENTLYVGWTVLALAVLAMRNRRTIDVGFIVFMTVVFLVMSMPVITVAGKRLVYLPSVLVHYVPFLHQARCPERFAVMVMLFLAPLSAVGVRGVMLARATAVGRGAVWGMVVVLVVCETMVRPGATVSTGDIPRVFQSLRTGDGPILEIPLGIRDGFTGAGRERTVQMFFQTAHAHPLFGGFLARMSDSARARFRAAPVIAEIVRQEEDSAAVVPPPTAEDVRAFMESTGIRNVVIDPDYRDSRVTAMLSTAVAPYIEDTVRVDGYALWRLREMR